MNIPFLSRYFATMAAVTITAATVAVVVMGSLAGVLMLVFGLGLTASGFLFLLLLEYLA